MRIWPGGASNWFSFSSQICQPSLALAKVIDLMTTLLSGRQMQPAQDWLPISIPQTYLMTAPSEKGASGGIFMAHLLFSFIFRPCSLRPINFRRSIFFRRGKLGNGATRSSVSSCWIGNLSWRLLGVSRWLVQQALYALEA